MEYETIDSGSLNILESYSNVNVENEGNDMINSNGTIVIFVCFRVLNLRII